MFRLFKPSPYQKTPLFPKRPQITPEINDNPGANEENAEEQDDNKNLKDDEKDSIPITFRSFRWEDLYSLPRDFTEAIVESDVGASPPVSNIFPEYKNPTSGTYNYYNNSVYGAKQNIMAFPPKKIGEEWYVAPLLLKKNIENSDILCSTVSVVFTLTFSNLASNHHYLAKIGPRLLWKDVTLELKNDSGEYNESFKVVTFRIQIENISFDFRFNYMYIRLGGLKREMRGKILFGSKYIESEST